MIGLLVFFHFADGVSGVVDFEDDGAAGAAAASAEDVNLDAAERSMERGAWSKA